MPGPAVLGNSVQVVHSPHFLANVPHISSEGVLLADDTAQVSIEVNGMISYATAN